MAGYSVIGLMTLAFIELSSFVFFLASADYAIWRIRIFRPVEVSDEELEKFFVLRDERLGWLEFSEDTDLLGERLSPANLVNKDSPICFEFYGDSFTNSAEVDHEHAWPNKVAEKATCRVLNFGVGGYGVDQAVLRHEYNERYAPHAGLVIYPVDIRRNLNRYRFLISRDVEKLAFKPRFIIPGAGEIELLPPFHGTVDDYRDVARDPRGKLEHERFLPDSDNVWSKVSATFPYSFSMLRLARKIFRETNFRRVLSGKVRHFRERNHAFYDFRDDELNREARMILEAVVERFFENCADKKQSCHVFLLPDVMLLYGNADTEALLSYYFEDIGRLSEFHDMTPFLRAEMKRDFCRFFTRDCKGHLTEAGYELVSRFVLGKLPEAFEHGHK